MDLLQAADEAGVEAVQALRWSPISWVFVLLSAWWVKGLAFAIAAAVADLHRARRIPVAAVAVLLATATAAPITDLLKRVFDRERPPIAAPDIVALVDLPGTASFPSGHAATAFAGAVALAVFHPRLRLAALGLAGAVALSRVYLGVHFWSDVLAGAALGASVGLVVALLVRRGHAWVADISGSDRAMFIARGDSQAPYAIGTPAGRRRGPLRGSRSAPDRNRRRARAGRTGQPGRGAHGRCLSHFSAPTAA